ncbi:U3 small nucleolar RNA-associated protein 25 [Aulographum hederae CBS 113979]|uniref:U3 small nucleolar RNA-associated protein 25 n=1 Tax=Aulographum hederae CBS 113979 TaxID=1176131 RepID=A0A6G1H4Y1_9PEZI|nr:U3 small nucleolar RNA-associated protein 25 [Aulographum hederae CBS 113979]
MAPFRGRGGRATSVRGVGRGRGRGRGGSYGERKQYFTTSRVEASDEDSAASEAEQTESGSDIQSNATGGESTDEEEEVGATAKPYNALLQVFQSTASHEAPKRKKRKTVHEERLDSPAENISHIGTVDLAEDITEDNADAAEDMAAAEAVDDEEDSSDPFEVHFANPDDNQLSRKLKALSKNEWERDRMPFGSLGRCTIQFPKDGPGHPSKKRLMSSPTALNLKKKLQAPAVARIPRFNDVEQAVASLVFEYQDLIFGARTVANAEGLRRLTCLHALNHILKTRDRVVRNNTRLVKADPSQDLEFRDQGFTRPKVLMLLNTRQSCAKAVETIMQLYEPEQQENKSRFQESFVDQENLISDEKPEDFREIFEGNDDNDFRLGVKFTRKTAKFFSPFYNSDIIFASPLGLRLAIDGKDSKKKDYDFLSSIEIVVMDQADAIFMQNWDHVEYIFEHLNLQPKDAHGCDFSRVRSWYLDGNSKHLRQNIILSSYIFPSLSVLYSKHMLNIAGKVRYQPSYAGAISSLNFRVKQSFSRFDSSSPVLDPDARFNYFTTAVVPSLSRHSKGSDGSGPGILVFIPDYLDFVKLRNYFANSPTTQNISFGAVSEYAEPSDASRARSHFMTGRHSVLLYTGRAHHFRRIVIKGVKRVIMYQVPENPIFYKEIVGEFIGQSIAMGKLEEPDASTRVLFSKWDRLALERTVGTGRVEKMIADKNDTFDFI